MTGTGVDLFGAPCRAVSRSAVFSPCGLYRLRLDRDLGLPGRTAFFGMVNPSRAGAEDDDHTVGKLYGFAERNGIGRFVVANEFALVATDVRDLADAEDPVGPGNDLHLERAMREADVHVVAWGPRSKLPRRLRGRWREVVAIAERVGCPLFCLGTANDGHPLHPARLGYDREFRRWTPPS